MCDITSCTIASCRELSFASSRAPPPPSPGHAGALHADEDDGDGRRGQDGAQGGRRTRMGGRLGGAGGFGRGGRGGRGGGRYGDRERGSGFMPESGACACLLCMPSVHGVQVVVDEEAGCGARG